MTLHLKKVNKIILCSLLFCKIHFLQYKATVQDKDDQAKIEN